MDIRAESADHIKRNLFTESPTKGLSHRQRSILLREKESKRLQQLPLEWVADHRLPATGPPAPYLQIRADPAGLRYPVAGGRGEVPEGRDLLETGAIPYAGKEQ